MAHTPGPWRIEKAEIGDRRDVTFEILAERPPAGHDYFIAQTSQREVVDEVRIRRDEANARLITAAPDLLAACKHVADWFARLQDEQHRKLDHSFAEAERNWPTLGDDTGPLDLQPLLDAIAKAEGQAPREEP